MNQISFIFALASTPEQVAAGVDSIYKFFGINNAGQVAPTDLVDAAVNNIAQAVGTHTAAAASVAELDKAGMPWDARIHSSSKNKNADGTWRYRKGLDAGTKTKVESELRITMGAGSSLPTAPPTAPTAPATPAATLPAPPATPGLPPIPGANVAPENQAYTNFVQFIVANTHSPTNPTGRLTDDWVKACLTQYGVADGSLQNLAHRPDLIPAIETGIRGALGL